MTIPRGSRRATETSKSFTSHRCLKDLGVLAFSGFRPTKTAQEPPKVASRRPKRAPIPSKRRKRLPRGPLALPGGPPGDFQQAPNRRLRNLLRDPTEHHCSRSRLSTKRSHSREGGSRGFPNLSQDGFEESPTGPQASQIIQKASKTPQDGPKMARKTPREATVRGVMHVITYVRLPKAAGNNFARRRA